MKFYITGFFLLVYVSICSAFTGGNIDSVKNLLTSSAKNDASPDTLYINRLNLLAESFFETSFDSTLFYGNKSTYLARKINYESGLAYGLLQTGHANFSKGEFEQARANFDEAIAIFKRLNDRSGLGKSYTLFGRFYFMKSDYKLALNYLNQSLSINLHINNQINIADCYKNLGIVYSGKGQLTTALEYYFKALSIETKLQHKQGIADGNNDIGEILKSMEMYAPALEYYKKALKIYEQYNDLSGIGTALENIGEIALLQKQYDKAITDLTKALDIQLKLGDQDGISSLNTDLGRCYSEKHDFKKALAYLNNALKVATDYQYVSDQASALIAFANYYNLQLNYSRAYEYALKGQELAIALGNLTLRADAALQLNNTLSSTKRFEEAYKMLRRYNDLKDSLHSNESIQKLTILNKELDFSVKEAQQAILQREKDELFQQRIEQQRSLIAVSMILVLAMIAISLVYYLQKSKQQKVNLILEEKNLEVLQQKTDLDEQAQKLNNLNILKDRLISVLAHDLRAPLSTLRGLFSLLQDETISHTQMLEMIPGVLKKLEYTSDFLDTLLFWINSQMDNFENSAKSFYLKEIAAFEADNYMEQASTKGIILVDNVPADLVASADPNSIRIVLRNLVTNAIKFSNRYDRIEISARRLDNDNQIVTVKDTGTGMTEEQLGKIFKSKVNSKTGTQNETGTGMGMLFCKDLVEKCNGKIWVNSKLGVGTEFSFTLPVGHIN